MVTIYQSPCGRSTATGLAMALSAIAAGILPANAGERYDHLKEGVPVVNQINAGDLDATGWCRARSKFGNYSVDLPGKYLDTMLKISNKEGGFVVMHHLMTKPSIGGEIGVSFMEIHGGKQPTGDPFDKIVEQNRQRGTLSKQGTVKIGKRDADHLAISAKEQLGDIYRIKTPKGDYMIILQYPKQKKDEFARIRTRLTQSFRILTASDEKEATPPKK